MVYEGAVYRPPSEANSLIIQATIGCSHNKCTFCSMYKDKIFRIRENEEIFDDLNDARKRYSQVKRIFLADGDAMAIQTPQLCEIADKISEVFPECSRVGIYASPLAILRKTEDELKLLGSKGIKIAYLGAESGSDKILSDIKKGATSQQILSAAQKIKNSGIKLSVTFISGIGGKAGSDEHAIKTAELINKISPDYVGLLALMQIKGTELYEKIKMGAFVPLNSINILKETRLMLSQINRIENCIFRSNHASNYLSLSGILDKDKMKLIKEIDTALSNLNMLKDERFRAL